MFLLAMLTFNNKITTSTATANLKIYKQESSLLDIQKLNCVTYPFFVRFEGDLGTFFST